MRIHTAGILKKRKKQNLKKTRRFRATLVCCLHAVDFGKEQQIEISVGAHESETTIFRHVNLCWSNVHAISPMLPGNDLVKRLLLSFGRWEHIRFLLLSTMIGRGRLFYVECNIADCICEGKKTGKAAPKHVFLSNMPRQLGNRRYTSWIQPKKWSAASMNLAEERAR